jgi:hypothetical protein
MTFLALSLPNSGAAQAPFSEIPFESLPDGTLVEGGGGGIALEGDVSVTQNLSVAGMVESGSGGFLFPDGTIQTTAAAEATGASSNAGLYNNRIVLMTPPQIYAEVCFKDNQIFADVHAVSETTAGGNCVPGDLGFIVERNQRSALNWENARLQCLMDGMRLPEAFEWFLACEGSATYGTNNMTGDWEWASNSAIPITGTNGIAVNAAGNSGCSTGSWGFVGNSSNGANSWTYRCVR